ncbi:MAG: response regulator, partial [Thermoplasmata archaeon]|nr:response regulator [Thermoplasmata archaeon]
MRLLIVDDDAVFREELSDILRDDGHEVHSAPSVPKAIEELEREDFDAVFSDLKMPRQSGLVLLRDVRQRWPQTLVVMITGFATVETAVDAMKLGAFDYIRKPFTID